MVNDYGYYKQLLGDIKRGDNLSVDRINLFGSRMSSKTFSSIDFFVLASLIKKCKTYAFRYMNDDKKKLFEQILTIIGSYPGLLELCEIHLTDKRITFPNGSVIEVYGLHKQKNDDVKLTGLSGAMGFDYGFAFAEERYEISDKEWSAVQQAIRGFDKYLEVHAANPWIFTNDYVAYCHEKMPFNLKTLKKNGQQFSIVKSDVVDEALNIKVKFKEILHYSNFSINHYLTDVDKLKLTQAAAHDPHRADTILYGYPGIPEGSIYKYVLDKMFRKRKKDAIRYVGCVDYGEKGDASTGYIIGFSANYSHAHIEHEYYWANDRTGAKVTKQHKDTSILAQETADHFMDFYDDQELRGTLTVYVDSAAIPFITALNNVVREYGMDNVIEFVQSKKYPVGERVEQVRTMASFSMITIDENCPNARREYQEAVYSKKTSEYRDGDDHAQDTIEYGLASAWVELLDHLTIEQEKEIEEAING